MQSLDQTLFQVKYFNFATNRLGYTYGWAQSRDEIAARLDNLPVDGFNPDGETYSQHFISITKTDITRRI